MMDRCTANSDASPLSIGRRWNREWKTSAAHCLTCRIWNDLAATLALLCFGKLALQRESSMLKPRLLLIEGSTHRVGVHPELTHFEQ